MRKYLKPMGLLAFLLLTVIWACNSPENVIEAEEEPEMEELTIDKNGLIDAPGKNLVFSQCSGCHSLKLVTQNRATREGWKNMIVWMQQTQNLWSLGENEDKILDYLSNYYSPVEQGRRANLKVAEWYKLD